MDWKTNSKDSTIPSIRLRELCEAIHEHEVGHWIASLRSQRRHAGNG
ncbi:MAG: hypothetical protein AAB798_01510 [Patescibacteria group bacterium]